MNSRIYTPNERPHSVFRGGANRYFYLRFGTVREIDYDRYTMTIVWLGEKGTRDNVPISFPYMGPAGCIGMVPEIGSVGIFGFYDEGTGKGSPVIVGFLPSGLSTALDHNVGKAMPDAIPTDDVNEIKHSFRKLLEGDLSVASPKGSMLFLNDSVELYDAMQDIIQIREGDQAILQNSLNNFVFADGVAITMGPIARPGLALIDLNGDPKTDISAREITLPSGKRMVYVLPFVEDITYDTQMLAEYRISVDELCDGKLDMNEYNSDTIASMRDPVVTQILGNYVGADRRNDRQYGRILKPIMFASSTDRKGAFDLIPTEQNAGVDEAGVLGLAYALHFHKSTAFFGFDKEGQCYLHMPKSRANPSGAGRSMSILGEGSLKERWGSDANDANSWHLVTDGGIKWDIGKHNTSAQGVSVFFKAAGSWNLDVTGTDEGGYSKRGVYVGNVSEKIGGNHEFATNNETIKINGLKVEDVTGSIKETCQSDRTISVSGMFSEIVVKEKQCRFGKRKTTITSGDDELVIQ